MENDPLKFMPRLLPALTHCGELADEISRCPSIETMEMNYTATGVEMRVADEYDGQVYLITVTPTCKGREQSLREK